MADGSNTPVHALHHPLSVDSGLGRVRVESDFGEHVRQMLIQLLLTTPGERHARPDFGCGLRARVFGTGGEVAASLLEVSVRQAIDEWMGELVRIEEVKVTSVASTLEVEVVYRLRTRPAGVQVLNLEVPA